MQSVAKRNTKDDSAAWSSFWMTCTLLPILLGDPDTIMEDRFRVFGDKIPNLTAKVQNKHMQKKKKASSPNNYHIMNERTSK